MDPNQLGTLVGLLSRGQPGASSASDLLNIYGKSGSMIPTQTKDPFLPPQPPQVDQASGLFDNSGMLGQSPYAGQGMLG